MADPFNASEPNPTLTNAIDSSLWELYAQKQHYHSAVSTLARIFEEAFTKPNYNLEDFLDHGYHTLIDAELGKEIKAGRKVEVEWEIPKKIITAEGEGGGMNALGSLLESAMAAT